MVARPSPGLRLEMRCKGVCGVDPVAPGAAVGEGFPSSVIVFAPGPGLKKHETPTVGGGKRRTRRQRHERSGTV